MKLKIKKINIIISNYHFNNLREMLSSFKYRVS